MNFPHSIRRLRLLLAIVAMALFASIQPTLAESGTGWTGEYFNNQFLSGSPALVRQDGGIGFNWGTGSPANGISTDNFSVRWATDAYFEGGTYRFSVVADDNVYLRVDYPSQPQINTFNNRAVGQTVSVDLTLSTGFHHIQLDYQELTGDAYVSLNWVNIAANPPAPAPQQPPAGSGAWTAQYYGNIDFTGSPLLTLYENTPTHNWGTGSPAANIPVDNFSARWTSVQTLAAGTYRITAKADDGVRVYVNGVLTINEWHVSTDATYSAVLNLPAGQHYIEVDYFESGGLAFLEFGIAPISNVTTPPASVPPVVNVPSTGTGTVTASYLNVRSEPNPAADILTKIRRRQTYPVIGRSADGKWWQINVNGTVGWVNGTYLTVSNAQAVTGGLTSPNVNPPSATGVTTTPYANVNMRSGPDTGNAIIGRVPRGTTVSIVGRNGTNTWWQVNNGSTIGWISASFAPLQSGTNIDVIPVTG